MAGTVKTLVVDDSLIMRNIVKNTFAELKYLLQCLEAENGNQAYKYWKPMMLL